MKINKLKYQLVVFVLFLTQMSFAVQVSNSVIQYSSTQDQYIEIYSKVKSSSIQWAVDSITSQVFSQIEYTILISSQQQNHVAEKLILNSPVSNEVQDFWDRRQYALKPGEYEVKLIYRDLQANEKDSLVYLKKVIINPINNALDISDIMLMSSVHSANKSLPFQKHGMFYEPLEYNLVNAEEQNLIFFAEIYNSNTSSNEEYFMQYYIENLNAEGLDKYTKTGYKKMKPDSFSVCMIDFPVKMLASGNYILHLEAKKKDKTLIAEQSLNFAIYNPYEDYKRSLGNDPGFERSFFRLLSVDELNYSLKAIFPRVGNNMTEILNYIIHNKELAPKQYFLYNFWSRFASEDMRKLYEQYMDVADAVDKTYGSNVGYGFETDRGHYFLKYGKPDDIIFVEDEPMAPPYEIWIYNYLSETQQTNVKFLFYNPSLASNDFILLHSNCRGERRNPRWELDLYSDAYNEQPANYIDSRVMPENFHRSARQYFSDF